MDGLLTLKEYIAARKCPPLDLAAWKRADAKKSSNLRHYNRSWPSLHHQNSPRTTEKVVPAHIDQDPFSYFLSPASESASDDSPRLTSPVPASKSDSNLPVQVSQSSSPGSHYLPQHSPTSSPESKLRRQKQREKGRELSRKAQEEALSQMSPEIVEIKPKTPEIVVWPALTENSVGIQDALSPLPEPFIIHSPSNRGRPQLQRGSKSRSRRTPPRSWRPQHINLTPIPEERAEDDEERGDTVVGLGII